MNNIKLSKTTLKSFTTIKERRIVSCNSFSFINLINKNRNKIIAVLHNAIINMPDYMNYQDYRFDKSEIIVRSLKSVIKSIVPINNEPYDITESDNKISLKISRCTEHNNIRSIMPGSYTKSKFTILKNFLSRNKKCIKDYRAYYIKKREWDYLFIIDPQEIINNTGLSFGIISFNNFKKLINRKPNIFKISGDQLMVKIKNNEWDYFYRHPNILPFYNEKQRKKLNEKAKKTQDKYFNTLLNFDSYYYRKVLKNIIEK